jgi:Phospholipase_D-nuclease N-terminal
MAMIFLPLLMIFFLLPILLLATVFWIWMLVDCATKEPSEGNDKIIWILVIIFTHWIGALIYYLVRRPERKKLFGV